MSSIQVHRKVSVAVIGLSLCTPISSAHSQDPRNIFGLFGGLMQAGMADAARREWQNRPVAEYDCLANHGTSVDALAAQGIGPSDPRVRRMISQCEPAPVVIQPQTVQASPTTSDATKYNPNFVVDGLSLGGIVNREGNVYRSYTCQSSEQFSGFVFCHRLTVKQDKFGPHNSAEAILHSEANNTTAYISQSISPAYFGSGDIDREIQKISQRLGLHPRLIRSDPKSGIPQGIIAAWGSVTLTPLVGNDLDGLANGQHIRRGFLFDFLNDARLSAKEGMPVYTLSGGPGYLYGATFDESGKGALQIVSMDASAFGPPNDPNTVSEPPNNSSSFANAQSTAPDQTTVAEDQERKEREKKQRLERILPVAGGLIDDAKATLIKVDPKNPKLLDYVELIAGLNSAIAGDDPDEIERKSAALSTQLSREPVFQKLEADRAEKQKQASAQYLGDAIQLAQKQKRFMLDFVSQNPTSPQAIKFVSLIKQVDPLLVAPELARLQPLTEKIALTIREAGLQDAFIGVKDAASIPPVVTTIQNNPLSKPSQPTDPASQTQIPITDKNRFLIEGDLSDIVLLYNASHNAPHVARNLRGDFVFSDDRVDSCIFGSAPSSVALTVRTRLLDLHPRIITGLNQACDPLRLGNYDVVAVQRGAFLRSNLADALSLTKSVETDELAKLALITAAQQQEAAEAERTAIKEITADIGGNSRSGFGLVLLKTSSPNVCMIVGDKTEALSQLLLANADKLSFEMHSNPTISRSSAEDAFINVQKSQCGAVYASATDLKTITEAMSRDGIPFSFSSIWMTPAEINSADSLATEAQRLAEQQSTERAQKAADEAKLDAQRKADQSATSAAQELAFRNQYQGPAQGALASIVDDVKAWTTGQRGDVGSAYPEYAGWLNARFSDHWDVMTFNSELADFGTSNFKGRALDTAFARVKLRLKNRILGRYDDACFLFGRVIDTEFSMNREPLFAACEDEEAVKRWKDGHQFQSRWIVGSADDITLPNAAAPTDNAALDSAASMLLRAKEGRNLSGEDVVRALKAANRENNIESKNGVHLLVASVSSSDRNGQVSAANAIFAVLNDMIESHKAEKEIQTTVDGSSQLGAFILALERRVAEQAKSDPTQGVPAKTAIKDAAPSPSQQADPSASGLY
jgi:hypothetical protein